MSQGAGHRGQDRVRAPAELVVKFNAATAQSSAVGEAHDQHTRALAIARDISAAPKEARALDGIGNSHLREGNLSRAAAHLQQALTIYQRIGAPGAEHIRETLRHHRMNPSPAASARRLMPHEDQ